MMIRTATLGLAALALIGCDGMGNNNRRNADAAEANNPGARATTTPAAPQVANIELGRQADESLQITDATTDFAPGDTVYLAVMTSNAASDSRLTARWTFQDGSVVDSSGQSIARSSGTSNAVTQFRIVHDDDENEDNAAGWRVGNYTVDVWMNDMLVGTKMFSVKR